jgi:octaprenyl-diphosphate synthase
MMDLKIYSPRDFPGYLPKLNALYDDLFAGGKGFRSKLIRFFAENLGINSETEKLLGQTIEFIHNASLLHDDLIDRSSLRRGKTTAWLKYTPEYAVLAGDYLLARVMVNLSSHGNIRLVQYTAEVISDLLEGEWIQDSLVKDFNITLEQLDRVHNLKTASLFKWCLRSPFIALNRNDRLLHDTLEEMGTLLGMLFQRSDDLLDFDIRNDEGKALLGDLKSGYLNSFAVFLSCSLDPKTKEEFLRSETLGQLKTTIGERYFDQKAAEFDQINQQLIARYDSLMQVFESQLLDNERKLVTKLDKLPELLYWRRRS